MAIVRREGRESFRVDFKSMDDLEEIAMEFAALTNFKEAFKELGIKTPVWLNRKLSEAKSRAKFLAEADKKKRLRKLKAEAAKLLTPEEKRKDIKEKIAALEAELGADAVADEE